MTPLSVRQQETQLSQTNRATRLDVNKGHPTIRYVRYGFQFQLVWYSNSAPKINELKTCATRFQIFEFEKMSWPYSLKVIESGTIR